MRRIPPYAATADWPRNVAQAITELQNSIVGPKSITTQLNNLTDYADDTAAAAGGVAIGEFYRTGSVVKIRVA